MTEPMFDQDDVEAAREVVRRSMAVTPELRWPLLDEAAGSEVWVKHENHTPTGSFKVRGGLVLFDRLVQEALPPAGVVSATRGNHGQSLAFAARASGTAAVIVVPEGNNPDKNAAMRALGAELVLGGADLDASRDHARSLAEQRGLRLIASFSPDLVLGVATYALELFTAVADLDVVYVPIGIGSGIVGMITVRDFLGLSTRIVGVVSAEAPAYALSVEAGRPVTTERAATFADGVACRDPDRDAVTLIARGTERVVTVSDDDIADAMRLVLRTTHNLVEPAGAIAVAAMMNDRERLRGKRVATILTGGNVDASTLATVLAGKTPRK